jgi:hypothetical protein
VGKRLDKSGNANHATQSVSSKRPTYRDVDGVQWLEFDGIDDSMDLGGGLLTPNSVTAFAFEAIGEIALAGDTGGGRFVGIGRDRGNEGFPSTLNVGNPTVLLDGASFTNKTQTELFFAASGNGKHIYSVGGDYTQWSNSAFIGKSNDKTIHHKGAIYGIILYEGETAQKTQDTEEYLTALTVPAVEPPSSVLNSETINLRVTRRTITLDQYPSSVSLRQTPASIKLEV